MAGNTGRTYTPQELHAITTYVHAFTEGKHYKKQNNCLIWIRSTTSRGYGTACIALPTQKVNVSAHKAAWLAHHQENIQPTDTIDHKCRNKTCINVEHMHIVSRADNNRISNSITMDLMSRTHCPRNHPLADYNLTNAKTRACKSCAAAFRARNNAMRKGRVFSEEAFTAVATAYYQHFAYGHPYPLFNTYPQAWENIRYQPKITKLEPEKVLDLAKAGTTDND